MIFLNYFLQAVNSEKKGDLLLKLSCLIKESGYKGETLQSTIETFFDYGTTRLNMIGQLVDIGINLKTLQFQGDRQQKTIARMEKAADAIKNTIESPTTAQALLMLKSDLMASFRSTELNALEYLYLQAASYK